MIYPVLLFFFVCLFETLKKKNVIDPDKICEEIFLKFTNKLLMNM
jgi:hypothetical protein